MFVNPSGLRDGASASYTAADHAHAGAMSLGRAHVDSSIFGNFAAARSFGEAVSGAHSRHVQLLHSHTEALGGIGDKANQSAAGFDEMETRNAQNLRDVYSSGA
jgi:hypothetical protein